ncbi:hypothetical protein [Amycolatopsis kentuckyensis]|uniref:hypothetical protein n=1 Tax=Amycolatopsis kentuckyensis TaxID=218823 RepID=UPI00356644A7
MAQTESAIDESIPKLWNIHGLADKSGVARTTVSDLYRAGLLPGFQVNARLAVFRDSALKRLRRNLTPSHPKSDPRLPELVTTAWVAEDCGVSISAIDARYRAGKLPGVSLGRYTLFRRQLVEQGGGPGDRDDPMRDPKIPDLVTREGAAEILGMNPREVLTWFHFGRIPGAQCDLGAGEGRSVLVFRESTMHQLDPAEITASAPARDHDIPDLVTGSEAGEILGVNVTKVLRMHRAGELPGRDVIGKAGDSQRTVYRRDVVEKIASGR